MAVDSGPARQVFVRGVDLSGSLMPKIFPEEGSERVSRTRGVVPIGEELVLKGKLAEVSVPPLHVRFGGLLRNWHYSPLQPARAVDTLKPWTKTRRALWGEWEAGETRMRASLLRSHRESRVLMSVLPASPYAMTLA